MDFRVLRYFVAVAEEGSFSKAALRLRVAQPALSQHLRKLEEELGFDLLHRASRGITLTESGARLLVDAKDILARVHAVQENLRHLASVPVGHVSFAMSQSVAKILAIPLFQAMKLHLPKVTLRLMDSNTGYIPEMLRKREVDLGVVFKETADPSIDHAIMLTEELYLVGPPSDGAEPITFADAARLPLVLPGRPHSVRELINDYARRCGVELSDVSEVDGIPQLRDFAEAGLGYTMLTPGCVRLDVAAKRLSMRRIVDPSLGRPVILCHTRSVPLSRAAVAVKQLAIDVSQRLVLEGLWPGDLGASTTYNEPV